MRVLVFTNMYPYSGAPFYGSFVKDEVDALRAGGLDVDVYFVNGRVSKLNYMEMPFGFWGRLYNRRYDIVHVHHSYCGFTAMLQRRVPVVWTFHEGEISDDATTARRDAGTKKLAYSKRFKRFVAQKVNAVIIVADHFRGPLGRPDAITIPAGIDTDLFTPSDRGAAREALGLDAEKRYVLFPSTPARVEKRYDLARAAVGRCRDRYPNIELIALDNVPHERVPMYMNASDLMLMTSAFEASPVTVREALACNVPVVSTAVGDVEDVLSGIDGCHVVDAAADAGTIADAVDKVLGSGARVDARERILEYSLPNVAARVRSVYEDVIRRREDFLHDV